MKFVVDLARSVAGALGHIAVSIIIVIALVVVGAMLIGVGAVHDMEWLMYAGVVVVMAGLVPVLNLFFDSH